jgi:hypothetical protein
MNDLHSELDARWREARFTSQGGQEWRGVALAVESPLHLVAAIREPDERIALLLEAPLGSAQVPIFRLQGDGMTVDDQRRPEEGVYRLAIVLERDELRDVFDVLAVDVIETVLSVATAPAAITSAIRRLEAWQACLRSRKQGLSKEEQLGLLSELVVLSLLAEDIGYADAIEAWQGPLDGIHDFNKLGLAIEVKGTGGVGGLLRISRLDQLETAGLSGLTIVRLRLREDRHGKSLPDVVLEIRIEVGRSTPLAVSSFNERLIRAGYLDLDARLYDGSRFVIDDLYGFAVASGFPRLTSSTVPIGVIDASYSIHERVLSGFRLDIAALHAVMKSMDGRSQ